LVYIAPNYLLNYLAFKYFGFESTSWRSFQKRALRTKFDSCAFLLNKYYIRALVYVFWRGRPGRDRIVGGFTTAYAISAFHHWCCEFKSWSGRGVQQRKHMFFLFTNQADELWQYFFLNRENDKAYIYSCFLFVCEMFMLITCRLLLEKSCYLSSGATRTTYDYD
jgi:hypothetical protein